jgi:outer membrane protein assembly factor BamE (lipoprotein component of BamABCDE complex)
MAAECFFCSRIEEIIMNATQQILRTRTLGLALAAGLGLAGAGAALAVEIDPQAQAKVQIGESQNDVRQDLGEPTRVQTYLLAPGSTWLYKMSGQAPDNEQVLRVVFDGQGQVKQIHKIDAEFVGLD